MDTGQIFCYRFIGLMEFGSACETEISHPESPVRFGIHPQIPSLPYSHAAYGPGNCSPSWPRFLILALHSDADKLAIICQRQHNQAASSASIQSDLVTSALLIFMVSRTDIFWWKYSPGTRSVCTCSCCTHARLDPALMVFHPVHSDSLFSAGRGGNGCPGHPDEQTYLTLILCAPMDADKINSWSPFNDP